MFSFSLSPKSGSLFALLSYNKKVKKIKQNWPILIISLILLIIFATNFTPGTYLIGWDNLMPELNIWMNIKRSLLAVWQEYQGLGLVGGMAHATDLIRQIILLPFVLVLPNNWIRYLWHFGMLGLGTFGVYFGVKGFAKKQPSEDPLRATSEVFNRSAFIAALFYLLNFGTIQIFWVPYEAFTTFWGFFPWLIISFITVMKKPSKRNWRNFVFWNILAIPSFYLQTLFVVYILCLGIIWLFSLRNTIRGAVKRHLGGVTPFLVILGLNAFWLLPFGYFLITNSHHPQEALINRISTEETFLRNQKRGYFSDFLTLKGYYLDFPDAGKPLMDPWLNHLSSTPIIIINYFLSAIILIGLIKAPNWLRGIFLISAVAMLSATPPFSWLNNLFRQSPFLNQVFRSPLTKFITPTGFSFAPLLAYGFLTIKILLDKLLTKLKLVNKKFIEVGLASLLCFGILISAWPVFKGNFIYSEMRNKLPEKYIQLVNYFKNQPKTARIANLPQGNFWGWTFYRFGADGSGFIWYGVEQPIMDRAFDVWNLKNERYYWELTYALQNQDLNLLKTILNKYSIQYVVFDDNVIFPQSKNWAKLALKTKDLLEKAGFLTKTRSFENIDVYKVEGVKTKPYLIITENAYPSIDNLPVNKFTLKTDEWPKYCLYDAANQKCLNPKDYPQKGYSNQWTNYTENLIYNPDNQTLTSFSLIADAYGKESKQIQYRNISFEIYNIPHEFTLPIQISNPIAENLVTLQPKSCNNYLKGEYDLEFEFNQYLRLSSTNDNSCYTWFFPNLNLNQAWEVKVSYRNISGYPLLIAASSSDGRYQIFQNILSDKIGWQTNYFIILPYQTEQKGIQIQFNNNSFNYHESVNDIASLEIHPANLNYSQPEQTPEIEYLNSQSNIWRYSVSLKAQKSNNQLENEYLVLPQSYDNGWLAVYSDGWRPKMLKDHVLINNWANGWSVDQLKIKNEKLNIYLVFWPQLLEFVGFVLLTGSIIFICRRKENQLG
jgi:hypothetical protein